MLAALLLFLIPSIRPLSQARPVAAYWSELSATRTVAAANAIPRPENTPASRDGDIADALLKLREYELTYDRTPALEGVFLLEKVLDRTPDDAWAHYAMGVSLARGPDMRQRPYAERTMYSIHSKGTLAALRAPRELKKALDLDPALHAAAIELASFALDMDERPLILDALKLLKTGARRDLPQSLIAQSRLHRRLGQLDDAQQLAQKAEQNGFDASLAGYERATTLFVAKGQARNAARIYFDAASQLTPAGSDQFFASLELLLTPEEAASWHATPLQQRAAWLRRFWDRTAALSGVEVYTRMAEHFRRTLSADNASMVKISPSPTAGELNAGLHPHISDQTPYAVSMIRFGNFDRAERFLYCKPGWDTLPLPMQPSLRECMQAPYARRFSIGHGECVTPSDRIWQHPDSTIKFLNCRAKKPADAWDHMAKMGQMEIAAKRAARGSSFYPAYATPLAIVWETYQFRGPGTGAELFAVVGVTRATARGLAQDSSSIAAVLAVTVADTIHDMIVRGSSDVHATMPAVDTSAFLLMQTSLLVPPMQAGALRVRLESQDGRAGAIAYGTIDVERFGDDSLRISDVVLSPEEGLGTFTRGDARLTLAPRRAYRPTEQPAIYYEVYGAAEGTVLKTEIRVEQMRNTAGALLDRITGTSRTKSLSFEENATAPHARFGLQQNRSLDLSTLEPGDYTITVTITDPAGRVASRVRPLTITE